MWVRGMELRSSGLATGDAAPSYQPYLYFQMLMETPDLFLEGQWDLLMMVTPDTLSLAWLPQALSDVFRDKFQD